MSLKLEIDDITGEVRRYVGPALLLKGLGHVPQFVDARQRLRDAHEPMWTRIDSVHKAARTVLSPDVDLIRLHQELWKIFAIDEQSLQRFNAYEEGLHRICACLGSPNHLFELMLAEDFRNLPNYIGLAKDAVELIAGSGIEDVNRWNWKARHMFEDVTAHFINSEPISDHVDPSAAKRNRDELERLGRKVVSSVNRPDPVSAIGVWILMRVQGSSVTEASDITGYSIEWTQKLLTRGNQLLGIKSGRGRPVPGETPVNTLAAMDFTFATV